MPGDAPRVVTIGGTDPLCGAGVFADLLVLSDNGVVPLAVVTAIVDQDSTGVHGFERVDPAAVARSLARTLGDAPANVARVGVLASTESARAVHAVLRAARAATGNPRWTVVDPVLAGGTADAPSLATDTLERALVDLLDGNTLVTPNAPELGRLLQCPAPRKIDALETAACALATATGATVLAKGGHLDLAGADVFVEPTADGPRVVRLAPLEHWPGDIHGTGCLLATLVAARLAHGDAPLQAVSVARARFAHYVATNTLRVGQGRLQFVHLR
jgi:hydroxymethylpyrimidine/phosphomethylpyrimidine kinase